ncbi:MAG: hypothetical protein A7315_11515 [Candidatus Altiarchaeales archaeon WOR_SM1_79]|nr:MAG: hypothetical protein A7315_11515 [Candidatus Altiarchaeales archaeon WOR_SM1_79]
MEPNVLYMGIGLVDVVAQNVDEIKNSEYGNEMINEIKQMERNVKNGEVESVLRNIETLKAMCEEYGIVPILRGNYSREICELENEKTMELLNSLYIRIEEAIHKFE